MPELPEVETVKIGLKKYLVGARVEDVELRLAKQFSGEKTHIIGATIKDVRRFGKALVIDLDNGYSIAIHIKLTGQLIYRNQKLGITNKEGREEVPGKFTHVIFHLSEKSSIAQSRDTTPVDSYLYYNDIRQFGWIKIVLSSKLKEQSFFKDLGPEPDRKS